MGSTIYNDMIEWAKYVPIYNERGIFQISLATNTCILTILSYRERDIYRGIGSVIFGIIGVCYWSQDTPSSYRNGLCFVDKCNCYILLGLYALYFEYYIQYILLFIAGCCYVVEFIYDDHWVIYHVGVHLIAMIACVSTFHRIL